MRGNRHPSVVLAGLVAALVIASPGCTESLSGTDGIADATDAGMDPDTRATGQDATVRPDAATGPDSTTPQDGCQPDYVALFPADRVLRFDLEMATADLQAIVAEASIPMDQPAPEVYYPARVTFEGAVFDDVGARAKGHGTRSPAKPSLKLDFDQFREGQRFYCLEKLNFNNMIADPTMMREAIAYSLFASVGVPASRVSYARLFINGQSYGLYAMVEQVDKRYLKSHIGEKDGNLYKMYYGAFLDYRGADPSLYTVGTWSGVQQYNKETNASQDDWSDLIGLMRTLDEATAATVETTVGIALDIDEILASLSVYSLLGSTDWYGNEGNNYYLYHRSDGAFVFIPWDLDAAFRKSDRDACHAWLTGGGENPGYPLYDRLFLSSTLVAAYEGHLRALLDGAYAEGALHARIDAVATLIRAEAMADPHRAVAEGAPTFDQAVAGLKAFVSEVAGRARDRLATGCSQGQPPPDDCLTACMREPDATPDGCAAWCQSHGG